MGNFSSKLVIFLIGIDIFLTSIGLIIGNYDRYNTITKLIYLNFGLLVFLLWRIINLGVILKVSNYIIKPLKSFLMIFISIIYTFTIIYDLHTLNIYKFNILQTLANFVYNTSPAVWGVYKMLFGWLFIS